MNIVSGAAGVSKYFGAISPVYYPLYPRNDVNIWYYHYVFRLITFQRSLIGLGKGILMHESDTGTLTTVRKRISMDSLGNVLLPIPSRDEQDQIVRYLDWQVSKINRLIGAKEKSLQLFQEFVNKQFSELSSTATIRKRLKYVVDNVFEPIQIEAEQYYEKTGMYNRGRGIFRRTPISGSDMGDSVFQNVKSNCVMISGQFAWEAAAYITTSEDEQGVISHRYYLLKPKAELPEEYIWCFLMSQYGQEQMKQCSHGAAGRNRPLNINELLNVYIPIPENNELLNRLKRAVKMLMEYRKAVAIERNTILEFRNKIISDVVTGQIDVRGIEVPEFEYVEESVDTPEDDICEEVGETGEE